MAASQNDSYRQRRPERTVLYGLVQEHLESFLRHTQEASGKRLPAYVEKEFRAYLECGIHAYGFAQAVCDGCGSERLLPFSCKRRGVCPSCNGRRMASAAANLVDRVITPAATLRQWVLSVPFELRLLLAAKPRVLSAVGRLFVTEVMRWQRRQAEAMGFEQAEGAAVSFCHRFGSSLNLNVHWHVVVPDGVFVAESGSDRVRLVKYSAPTKLDLEEIVSAVGICVMRWLGRHGYLRDDSDDDGARAGDESDSPWLRCLQGSLGVGDLQQLGRGGSDGGGQRGRGARPCTGLSAECMRFNLHAGVSAASSCPSARERLLRYCARPPLALERLSKLDDGRICYRLKNSKNARVMSPMQFMARLAALVPPPRHPLVRLYGAWAPHSHWRSRVVPAPRAANTRCVRRATDGSAVSGSQPRVGSSNELCRPCKQPERSPSLESSGPRPQAVAPNSASVANLLRPDCDRPAYRHSTGNTPERPTIPTGLTRLDWATLYQRVFDVDPLKCERCGGRMRFAEGIEELPRARAELERRGLEARPPPLGRARSPDWPH